MAELCVSFIRQTLRYKGRESERDRETVMSTPVESDKRDAGRAGLHNESSSTEVACGRDGGEQRGRDEELYSSGE